ncbi:MAG TPA: acylphosphatase [Candidatus Limnocylindrales bacterium]|nr:acylphosphatase [Candidatus Limnocylindrales bacterium]
MTRLEATVHGHVQGVGFRWYVVRRASRLGLTGWVANQADGSVRLVAEGPDEVLERLAEIISHGPAGARVDRVDAVRLPASGSFTGFVVRASAHGGD